MALTESIVEIALEEARKQGARKVTRVSLDIGALSSVEPEALEFCFSAVASGTAAGWCLDCEQSVPLAERFGACPRCGGYRVRMTAGDELKIREMEID
jgi:hydrogenase nickel incorporation protein HypA/HybF